MIRIADILRISQIQEAFSSEFPYLKLEFSKKSPQATPLAVKQPLINVDKTLSESRTIFKDGKIEIVPTMTVSELEQKFNDIYGLSTQVFRKSGNIWLVTTITDKWTLEEQNRQGEIITKQFADRKSKIDQV
ncbi:hypothetical protein GALL_145190 [mine drainage metagenome]|uniref:Uncharacterized protein n=1 Tax=mine drainage metagenome TaxID=410659 RepID=A0A1J5S583_9ZZZZ